MAIRFYVFWVIFGCFAIFPISALSGSVVVDFNHNGKSHSVSGRQMKSNAWIFNEGAKKTIKITTLDWPPYISENICRQGWVQQLTVAIFASRGHQVISTFYPWLRTINEAERGKADILYPEYFIERDAPSDIYPGTKRVDHLALSRPFPGGPVALMKRKGEYIKFKGNLLDLEGETIGVVRGYQNTPEFDRLMDQGFFKIIPARDDISNVKKLAKKRVNLIIGDPSVVRFAIAANESMADADKKKLLDGIETVKPVLQYNHLYYAVSRKTHKWRETLTTVNRALDEFEESGELVRIIRDTNAACGFVMDSLDLYGTEDTGHKNDQTGN